MLGALLAGALLSPIATALSGRTEPTEFRVPLMVVLSIAAVVASVRLRHRSPDALAAFVGRATSIAIAAGVIAIILERGTNAFYTSLSLLDGTAALLILHVASRAMRWIAVEYRDNFRLGRHSTASGRQRTRGVSLPAVALADGLASVSAWSLLGFWSLVALQHRHVASLVLITVAVMLLLECIILIPDTLAGWGLLPRTFDPVEDTPDAQPSHSSTLPEVIP